METVEQQTTGGHPSATAAPRQERRRSRRIRRRLEVKLETERTSVAGHTLDVSSFGARLLLPKAVPLVAGERYGMIFTELKSVVNVQIIWVNRQPEHVVAGVCKVLTREGNLGTTPLHEILFELMVRQRTGELKFIRGAAHKSIFVRNGEIIWATSDQEFDSLGALMVRDGRLDSATYERLVGINFRQSEKTVESLLLERGHLKAKDLEEAEAFRTAETVKGLFGWSEGEFMFDDGRRPPQFVTLRTSTSNLIVEGIRRASMERVNEILEPIKDIPLSVSLDPLRLFQQVSLKDEEKTVMGMVDGKTSLTALGQKCTYPQEVLRRAVAVLTGAYLIELGESIEEDAETDLESGAEPSNEKGVVEARIDQMYRRLHDLTHYEILGVPQSADGARLKKAYYQKARDFHPDLHHKLGKGYGSKLNVIFSLVNEVYEVLSDNDKRKKYDHTLDYLRSKRVTGSVGSAAPRPATSPPEAGLSAEDMYRNGNTKYNARDFAAAAEFYKNAARLDPEKGVYFFAAGKTLMFVPKRLKEAEEYLLKSVEKEPFNTRYLLELGNLYLKARLGTRAVRTFEEVLKIDQNNAIGKKGYEAAKRLAT